MRAYFEFYGLVQVGPASQDVFFKGAFALAGC